MNVLNNAFLITLGFWHLKAFKLGFFSYEPSALANTNTALTCLKHLFFGGSTDAGRLAVVER